MRLKTLTAVAAVALFAAGSAAAQTVVSTGVVLRGLTVNPVPVPAPAQGTPVNPGRTCDFSREEVDQNGRMTGASVQCRAGGNVANTVPGMAANFTAYCVIDASRLRGRLITAAVPGNANHCDLSGVTRSDATGQFGGAKWR